MGVECKILKDFGVVADHDGVTLKLQLIKWGNNPIKYDLRVWQKDYAKGGITLNKAELKQLKDLIDSLGLSKEAAPKVTKKRGRPAKVKAEEPKKVEEPVSEEKEDRSNIIRFPKVKPEIEKVVTKGNASYKDCETKINKDRAIFKDSDSQYVFDGLLELCKVDGDFRNNLMREDKNFSGAMLYMRDMCQKGYGYLSDNGQSGWLDRDSGLALTIDYFNSESKAKATTIKTTEAPKKRGRKKKGA